MAKKLDKTNKATGKAPATVYLDPVVLREIEQMGANEHRRLSQMLAVLIGEAMAARRELVAN